MLSNISSATIPNHSLWLLGISMLALFLGPIIHWASKDNRKFLQVIDGFTLIVVVDLVLVHLLPHAVAEAGWPAGLLALAGLLAPTMLEKRVHKSLAQTTHILVLILAMIGICFHSFTDGLALFMPHGDHGITQYLPFAIILHRFPVGLTIWWLLKPTYGNVKAMLMLLLMSVTTFAGYSFGAQIIPGLDHSLLGLFEALVAGSLLHVMFHRHEKIFDTGGLTKTQWPSAVGALMGLALIIFMTTTQLSLESHNHDSAPFAVFLTLALTSAPALVFAYFMSGIIQTFLPETSIQWMAKGGHMKQAIKGMAFGLPLPICSCGVVPVYQGLIKKGVPLSAAMAFFVATPELGLDAIFLSIPLLGTGFTGLRLIAAAVVALLVGWYIGKKFELLPTKQSFESNKEKVQPFTTRLKEGLKLGFVDVVDHTAPWILFGLAIAALAHPILNQNDMLRSIPWYLEVPAFALLGLPVYVCATGITPFVAVLLLAGVSPGAALAFLLTGPATNVTTFGILSQLHGRKLAITFAASMAILSISIGYAVNLLWPKGFTSPILDLTHQHGSTYQNVFLILLTLIFLASLMRRGPRYLINQIVAFGSQPHNHDHDHKADDSQNQKEPSASGDCCH